MERTVSNSTKCCATCTYWEGHTKPDALRNWITVYDDRSICNGGGFNRCHVMALASCGNWEPRYKK